MSATADEKKTLRLRVRRELESLSAEERRAGDEALFAAFLFGELPDFWSFVGYAVIIAAALIKYFHAHKNPKPSKKKNVHNEKGEL